MGVRGIIRLLAVRLAFGGIVLSSVIPIERLLAQEFDVPAAAAGIERRSSAEIMERPIGLTDTVGKLSRKVSTNSPEAQAYYDQGVALLHSYVWIDAARSFHEALRRDPQLAMAELGLAQSYAGADAWAQAFEHLNNAVELASRGNLTANESKRIAICQVQFNAIFAKPEERSLRHQVYKDQIEELIAMDPDNPHAWVLRGNAEESRPQGRGQGGGVGSIAFYEAALTHDPDYWPADHYLVHSYENLGHYTLAAEHGKRYASAVPGIPHAQHMFAHVLPRLGRWQEAAEQLQKADALQSDYFDSGISPIDEWHHGHNLHLLGVSNLRLGNETDGAKYLKAAFDLPVRGIRDGRFTNPWLEYLLLRGRFEEALAAAQEAEQRPLAAARLIGAVRAAEALIGLDRIDDARRAQQRARSQLETLKKDSDNPIYDYLPGYYQFSRMDVLEAELALAGDDPGTAEQELIAFADRLVGETNFDGWATGLFRLEQLAALADRLGRTELVSAMVERMHRIDPGFASRFQPGASNPQSQTQP